jgi:hypothetical protein
MLAITLDIDWAPDYAIDAAADSLRDAGVRATWFVTHASPAVDRLRDSPELFELGVHPNFFAGSEHGASLDDVLACVKDLVPEARSIRSHGLYQSSQLLAAIARDERLDTDVSLFLPGHPHLRPVTLRLPAGAVVRVPYFWSDDHEMAQPDPAWSVAPLLATPGLKVLNFHPVHVFLNAVDTTPYAALQAASPSLREADRTIAERHVRSGPGIRSVLDEAVEHLHRTGTSATISDIARGHAAR